jgi:drug/metabolite transporter (DMT)-like permease
MPADQVAGDANSRGIIAAVTAVCLFWGGTFFAIRIAVETIPPFSMIAIRCLLASCLLLLISVAVLGDGLPTASQWRTGVVAGLFLFLGCHGFLALEEQRVPSSVAALVGATTPIWMVILDALRPGGRRPSLSVTTGLVLGMIGIAILGRGGSRAAIDGRSTWGYIDVVILLGTSASWAIGSLYGRRAIGSSTLANTAAQLAWGALALAVFATLRGEWESHWWLRVSVPSMIGLAYLVVFGSVIGLTAFVWLMRVTTPARAGLYAYVVPLVAVLIGVGGGREPVTTNLTISLPTILASVALLSRNPGAR